MSFSNDNENKESAKFSTETWKQRNATKKDKMTSTSSCHDHYGTNNYFFSKSQGNLAIEAVIEENQDDLKFNEDLQFEARGVLKLNSNKGLCNDPYYKRNEYRKPCKQSNGQMQEQEKNDFRFAVSSFRSDAQENEAAQCHFETDKMVGESQPFKYSGKKIDKKCFEKLNRCHTLTPFGLFEKKQFVCFPKIDSKNSFKSNKNFNSNKTSIGEELFDYEGKVLKSIFKKKGCLLLDKMKTNNLPTKNTDALHLQHAHQRAERTNEIFNVFEPKESTFDLAKSAPYANDFNATKAASCYKPPEKKLWWIQ